MAVEGGHVADRADAQRATRLGLASARGAGAAALAGVDAAAPAGVGAAAGLAGAVVGAAAGAETPQALNNVAAEAVTTSVSARRRLNRLVSDGIPRSPLMACRQGFE